MAVGRKIVDIRKKYSYSQEDFAKKFNVTRQTVSNWENNKHYPDIETLGKISDEFGLTFDELLKEDSGYIKEIDGTIKSKKFMKKIIVVLILIILAFPAGAFLLLHYAYQATPYSERILTDTDVRLIIDTKDSYPSAAITKTLDAAKFYALSDSKKMDLLSNVAGRVEGDIPRVSVKDREASRVDLKFQDESNKNIIPKVEEIKIFSANGMPVRPVIRTDKQAEYSMVDGSVRLYLADFIGENELVFKDDYLLSEGDDEGNIGNDEKEIMFVFFEIEFEYKGKNYISMTSLAL